MKKILACAICLFAMSYANSALAVSAGTAIVNAPPVSTLTLGGVTNPTTNPQLLIQLSANVVMTYTPETAGMYYAVAAYHNKGSRTFTSTSNDSKIFYQDTTAAGTFACPITSATSDPGVWLTL
ncbi:MAG: hypothetical protein NTY00_10410 [Deltaproteobacteria bacterium]|nr:hypothetical protein [Deltaproteobacteria bacterium]